MIQTYERIRKDEGKPAFIFNVTMQNHGGYETGYFEEHVISVPGREKKYKDVEEYLSLIKESDDALPILIEYFAEIEEPTVIAFFGDHQPKLDNSYYEEVMGEPLSERNLDEEQKRFEVPFFIWANYDISGADNIRTSANYLAGMVAKVAGIKMTPYLNFLCDMKKDIPAININGYQTKDGIWHYFSDKTEAEAFLDNYKDIQYNNVFAKRKCKKWFTVNWDTAEDSDQPGI